MEWETHQFLPTACDGESMNQTQDPRGEAIDATTLPLIPNEAHLKRAMNIFVQYISRICFSHTL